MDALLHLGLALAVSTILSLLAYQLKLLTWSGALSSFVVGTVIGFFGSLNWLLVLVSFTFLGFIVTRIDMLEKTRMGLQEGIHGERTHTNVLAVGLPPCVLAIIAFLMGDSFAMAAAIGYISVISVAASDTVASELGVKYEKVWLITTFRRVAPGTDGGVSLMGTTWALLGAVAASVLGWVIIFPSDIFSPLPLIPIVAGFVGCLLDSVLGATLETWGVINKYSNNAITMLVGGGLGILIYLLL
jgi:uncharacterized protein (TIGR00297 family)